MNIDGLLAALGLLTRVPVPSRVFADASARRASLAWYPVVGLLLGLVLAAFAGCLRDSPPLLAAALLLLAWVGLTGGLHLDGLADSADAWVGGLGDRERTLAIMKDPRSGPAGVTAVVLVLLIKFAALASLQAPALVAIVAAPVLGRAALTAAFLTTPYVRAGGMGEGLSAVPRAAAWAAIVVALAAIALAGARAVIAVLAVALLFWCWRRACLRRLGGMTGDTCGALAEMAEAAVLLVLAL